MDPLQLALRSSLGRLRVPIVATSIALALFLIIPVVMIIPAAVTSGAFLRFPPEGISPRWFQELLRSPEWRVALLNSGKISSTAALLATVSGTLAALAMRRLRFGARFVRTLFLGPLIVPPIVYALGLYLGFDAVGLLGNWGSLALGQGALAFPLVFVVVWSGVSAIDPNLPRAAATLGSRWPGIFWRVELPLLARSIAVAAIFALVIAFDEVVIALFLAPPGQLTFPVQIWRSARESVSPVIAAANTFVLALGATLVALTAAIAGRRAIGGRGK
jgi:putative spermidine/putrescine transport system permease protein